MQIFCTHTRCHWIWWEESGSQNRRSGSARALSLVWNALRERIKHGGRSAH
jgi:hypothetical protein